MKESSSTIKNRRRRRKIIWILGIVLVMFLSLHVIGVDAANAPEVFRSLIRTIIPPKPIVKSKVILSASVQSSIEDLAKQEIQQQNANATLQGTSNANVTNTVNSSLAGPLIYDIRIALMQSPVEKAKLRLAKIDLYISELQNLLANDRSTGAINKAVGLIQNIGNETGKITGDPKTQGDRTVLTLLIQQYNRMQVDLQKVEDTLPMDGYLKVEGARVKYVLKPAQDSLNNAPNLEVVNNIGLAEVKNIVGPDFAELKSIEILTDLGGGLSSETQTKLVPIQKNLALQFEKRTLKFPSNVRQRKLDNYMNFSYGNPVIQVKAFDQMQGFLTDRQVILGINNLKEIALQKLSDQISETNDPALDNQFLDSIVKNPKDLEVLVQMQLQKNNPKLDSEVARKTVDIFGKDPQVFKNAFAGEKGENVSLLDVALTNYLHKTLVNDSNVNSEVKVLATDLKKSVLGSFTQNINKKGFNTTSKLSYNPVPDNADVKILIPNPGAIQLLNSLKIDGATQATKSILAEHLLSGTISPEVFNEYFSNLTGILSTAKLAKVKDEVASIEKQDNQKLFETVQRITQDIFLTSTTTGTEKLLPDQVQQEISKLKTELPTKNIPQLTLPEGVVLPEVAKLPDDINNAIVTAAQDEIKISKKSEDLKLSIDNLAKDLGVSVPTILPDNPLYPIVEIIRTVELVVTVDPIARAELLLKQDNEKTLEAAKLVENSQSVESVDLALKTLSSVNDDFNKLKSHTDEIVKLSETQPQKVDDLVSQIVDNGLARQTVFSEIESKVHDDVYVAVEVVRAEILTKGIDTLLTLTNNDVPGLVQKLETAVSHQQGGTLSEVKAVELLNEIARTEPESTQKLLQESETKLAQNLETEILAIPEEKRTETVLAYAHNASGNPVREFEAYDVIKDNFTNSKTILLAEGMKSEAVSNLTERIAEITDAATQLNFIDKVVGNEPQDLKVAVEVEANVAPLPTTSATSVETLPIVQKVEDMKVDIEQSIIDNYKNKPDELAKADFFDNPALSKTPDVSDLQVVQDLQQVLERSPEVAPAVVQVAKDEGTKIVDTFIQNVSDPAFQTTASGLAAQTLNPVPDTLAALIDLKNQVNPSEQAKIDVAITAQVELMQIYLTTQVTDPTTFETYINQIAQDPQVAQVVQDVGGQSFQNAVNTTAQILQAQATTDQTQLTNTIAQVQQEIFSAPITNPSPVEQTLPQPVQAEIEQIKQDLPVAQIPAATVEVAVQAPVPTTEPAPAAPAPNPVSVPPAPEPVVPAPEAPKVGL